MNSTIKSREQFRSIALCILGCIVFTASSGCQIAPKDKPFKWPWSKDDSKPLPDRILPVWTDSVLHQPNKAGVRGFGGRIYFYAKDDTDPIEVDGSLAVYVFDADDIDVSSQKPLRKFMFTAEQFETHMSKTSIGPSYSVWLPWGEIGGPPRRLSLIARFEGKEGGTTISDPTIKLLPGVPTKEHVDESNEKSESETPFRLSGHRKKFDAKAQGENTDEAAEESTATPSDIKTIDLPPSFQRHLRSNPNDVNKSLDSKPKSTNDPSPSSNSSDSKAESEISSASIEAATATAPLTTQVYDYRTRKNQGAAALNAAKNDIRQGRWIESIERNEKAN